MDDLPYPRLLGFLSGALGLVFLGAVAGSVFHEPPGPPQQVYIVE